MERKLTILMRALLAVALVAITLVLTYEFWQAGNGKSSLDVQEIRFAGVYQPEGGSGWAVWTPEISLDNARYPIVVLWGHFDKPIPENRKIYFYICHIGMELHQNGIKIGSLGTPRALPPGTRTAGNGWFSLTSPRYFDHGRNHHHPFLPLQKRYAGTLRLFAERNPCGGRSPALSEILAPPKACWSCWGPS